MSTPETNLPPAGHERREELKRRMDALTKEAEHIASEMEIEGINPKALDIDNEIADHFDPATSMLDVSDANPSYVYRWEQADLYNRQGNIWVTTRKAEGWEVVSGSDPEAKNCRQVDGTRRVGDAILMRIRKDRYIALELADRRRRLSRSESVSLKALEMAEKAGIPVHDLSNANTPKHILQFAEAQAAAATAARQTMVRHMRQVGGQGKRVLASELASRRLDSAIRSGRVPGMPAPGAA